MNKRTWFLNRAPSSWLPTDDVAAALIGGVFYCVPIYVLNVCRVIWIRCGAITYSLTYCPHSKCAMTYRGKYNHSGKIYNNNTLILHENGVTLVSQLTGLVMGSFRIVKHYPTFYTCRKSLEKNRFLDIRYIDTKRLLRFRATVLAREFEPVLPNLFVPQNSSTCIVVGFVTPSEQAFHILLSHVPRSAYGTEIKIDEKTILYIDHIISLSDQTYFIYCSLKAWIFFFPHSNVFSLQTE